MTTQLKNFIVPYGDDVNGVNGSDSRIAKNGVTARTVTFGNEETVFNVGAELITGLVGSQDKSSRYLTLSSLEVPPNASTKTTIAIVPSVFMTDGTPLPNADKAFIRQVISNVSPTYESLSYDNGSEDEREKFIFTGVTLGNKDLPLGGSVSMGVAGTTAGLTAFSCAPNDTRLTTGNPTTGFTNFYSGDFGSFPVEITIQALLGDFSPFVLPKGTVPPENGVLKKQDGVSEFDFTDLIDDDGALLEDFLVDPSVVLITEQFTTSNVKFLAGSRIPEGTQLALGDYAIGSIDIDNVATPFYQASYAYGTFPRYSINLPPGTIFENGLSVLDGYSLSAGTKIPVGSSTSGELPNPAGNTRDLVIENLVMEPGYIVAGSTSMTEVILRSGKVTVPEGVSISQYQPILVGASTEKPLSIDQIQFPDGTILDTTMTFDSDYQTSTRIVAGHGSLVKSGTSLPAGSTGITGAKITGELVLPTGSLCTSAVSINNEFLIEAGKSLDVGTVLRGPFEFPVGGRFYEGNILPTALKLIFQMAAVLSAGMEIGKDSIFGGLAVLYGNIGFDPKGVIPALSTLFGDYTLPSGTSLDKDFNVNVPLPVPNGTKFKAGEILPDGVSFKQGSSLPPIVDIRNQCSVGGSGVLRVEISDIDGSEYYVIKAGTSLIGGFTFPVGSVIAKDSGNWSDMVAGGGVSIDFSAGSFSFDNTQKIPAGIDHTVTTGVLTETLIVLLTDYSFTQDVAIPVQLAQDNLTSFIGFNENFILKTDLTLLSDFVVHGNNTVMWPASYPIPVPFVFTSQYTIHFTNPCQISKKIQFNVSTTNDYIFDVMAANATLKLPAAGYKLDHPIKLAVDQPVAGSGTHAFRAPVTLSAGTKLRLGNVSGLYITLNQVMVVTGDFRVDAPFPVTPRILLRNGVRFPKGQELPGEIHIKNGQGIPSNIELPQSVTLAADVIIADDEYVFQEYSIIKAGTKLAPGSYFDEDTMISSGVTLDPILVVTENGIFYFFEGSDLTTDVKLPSLYDSDSGSVKTLIVSFSGLLQKVKELKERIDTLELSHA